MKRFIAGAIFATVLAGTGFAHANTVATGKALYMAHCSGCHRANGAGAYISARPFPQICGRLALKPPIITARSCWFAPSSTRGMRTAIGSISPCPRGRAA